MGHVAPCALRLKSAWVVRGILFGERVATASEEQSATSEEITRSVDEINGISRDTAQIMASSAKAVEQLVGEANALKALVHKMKSGA